MGIKSNHSSLLTLPINPTDLHLVTGCNLTQIYNPGRLGVESHYKPNDRQSLKHWLKNLTWLSA
jgi:hypothetical protein